jgi:hypothetical protein
MDRHLTFINFVPKPSKFYWNSARNVDYPSVVPGSNIGQEHRMTICDAA